MTEAVVKIVGQKPGPKSIVLAGVHGNEPCGVDAFKTLLPNLKIDRGEVNFLLGNPRALKAKTRFTEANLNRMFKPDQLLSIAEKQSYEYQRAQILKRYLNRAEVLLDLHASCNPSPSFAICETNAASIVEYLPVSLLVSGFDQVEPGGTDYYMNQIGKIGICVECGLLDDPRSSEVAEEAIWAFLVARGHRAGKLTSKLISRVQIYQLYLTKTADFSLTKNFVDFETLRAGQVIARDGQEIIQAKRESVILFAQNPAQVGAEAFLLGEKKKRPDKVSGLPNRSMARTRREQRS